MAHKAPEFEQTDALGITRHFNGSVGTTSVLVPSVTQGDILEVLVKVPVDQPNSRRLKVSFDGGTTYLTLIPGDFVVWDPRKNNSLTLIQQIRLEGNVNSVDYETLFNFAEP